jgi:serine protease inhibitor
LYLQPALSLTPCNQGLIPALLPATEAFSVALVNALYFKGNWAKTFNPAYADV